MIKIHKPNIFPEAEIISGLTFGENSLSFTGKAFSDEGKTKNRKIFAEQLGVDFNDLIFQKQVHEETISIVDENYFESESDALITLVKGKILNISSADCLAVLIYDPANKIIAVAHSGWKGTKLNISSKTIKKMQNEFSSKTEDLLVYLSPCASSDNYEVGKEFLEYFPNYVQERNDKLYFDNRKAVLDQLLDIGIQSSNIENHDVCTIANKEYHSYRRDGNESGRMTAFLGMR